MWQGLGVGVRRKNKSSSAQELKAQMGLADHVAPRSSCPVKRCQGHPRELPACISLPLTHRVHGFPLLGLSPLPRKEKSAKGAHLTHPP